MMMIVGSRSLWLVLALAKTLCCCYCCYGFVVIRPFSPTTTSITVGTARTISIARPRDDDSFRASSSSSLVLVLKSNRNPYPDDDTRNNRRDEDDDDNAEERSMTMGRDAALQSLQDRVDALKNAALVESIMDCNDELITIQLVGQTKLPTPQGRNNQTGTRTCLVLTQATATNDDQMSSSPIPCILVPIDNDGQLQLLQYAKTKRPILSQPVLLRLNSLLVNRDDGLFDNMPWSTWSKDPQRRNYDAANNPIESKFHFGKRDAYNRFLGKDWRRQGNRLAIGNLLLRLKDSVGKTATDNNTDKEQKSSKSNVDGDEEDMEKIIERKEQIVLAKRIMEIQIREQEMDLAELDSKIAIVRQQQQQNQQQEGERLSSLDKLEQKRQTILNEIETTKRRLNELLQPTHSSDSEKKKSDDTKQSSLLSDWLQEMADSTAMTATGEKNGQNNDNAAPYRGALGYAPMLDSQEDVVDQGSEQAALYTSPYDFMKEILHDQLNAHVIGTVLENTSWLSGTTTLGGAVILQRKTPTKSMTLAGETLTVNDEDETYGNDGIQGGTTYLVECNVDEAIGMSLACQVPLRIETNTYQRTSTMMTRQPPISSNRATTMPAGTGNGTTIDPDESSNRSSNSVRSALPVWKTVDPELSILVEGQASNTSTTERVSRIRIPRTTSSLFDSLFDSSSSASSSSRSRSKDMFPTDNPVESLSQYDAMTNEDKAMTLMTMSNFDGKLPRPRVVRQAEKLFSENNRRNGKREVDTSQQQNPLDKLLLPLVDETVRKQFMIRDAERRGDMEEVQALQRSKSRRQQAKEMAEIAREIGNEDLAEKYEQEAELYGSLRADVTQDEGSYSRFLDRDEWYERQRAEQAKKIDKSKFGTLLDGLE